MTVAVLLDSRAALGALRQTLPPDQGPIKSCRTAKALVRSIETELIDSVVLGSRCRRKLDLAAIRARFPGLPIIIYGSVRPDEGRLLLDLAAQRIQAVVVEGVDDCVAGDLVARSGRLAARRAALADLPRLLRLTEPLQRRAFDLLVAHGGKSEPTLRVARRLRVSREHLSRQFGAGGAPNLKRVIDLLQVLAAHDLVRNPGYPLPTVTDLLGFSNPRHLQVVVRRIVGLSLRDWRKATLDELVRRFVISGARSRE